jgi:hypothetical protein
MKDGDVNHYTTKDEFQNKKNRTCTTTTTRTTGRFQTLNSATITTNRSVSTSSCWHRMPLLALILSVFFLPIGKWHALPDIPIPPRLHGTPIHT